MWLILVDRSASMGEPFAGNVNGVDQRSSRLSTTIERLSAVRADLSGSQLLYFASAELTGPPVELSGPPTAGYPTPEPVGTADVKAALDWAHDSVAELDLATEVQVLVVSDLRTTEDDEGLREAADRLRRRATVHLVLIDPIYQTSTVASIVAPGRVELAASAAGLSTALHRLLPAGGPPSLHDDSLEYELPEGADPWAGVEAESAGSWYPDVNGAPGAPPPPRQPASASVPPFPVSPPPAPGGYPGNAPSGEPGGEPGGYRYDPEEDGVRSAPGSFPTPAFPPPMPTRPGSAPPAPRRGGGLVSRAVGALGSIFHRDSPAQDSQPAPAPQPTYEAPAPPASAPSAPPASSGAKPASGSGPAERLSFTVAHPPEMVPGTWQNLLFVLYKAGMRPAVDELLRSRKAELGGEPAEASSTATTPVSRGTILTLVPSIPGVSCNPPRVDVAWYEDVQETTFRVSADADGGPTRLGAVEVYAGPLLIAVVPLAIRVVAAPALVMRLVAAESAPTEVSHAHAIDRVFASYSRRDTWMVDACAAAYHALGVEVLIDRVNLRSGESWRDSLHNLISRSDIFQLYWSESSASSSEVENEWRYAASLSDRGGRFIRPMFWETPMPDPPAELSHLHFSRIELDQINALPRA